MSFPTTLSSFISGDIATSSWANAIEAKLGIDGSSVTTSLDYLIKNTSSKLGKIASLSPVDGNFIVGDGTSWVAENGATVRTSLGIGTTDVLQFGGLGIGVAGDSGKFRVGATSAGTPKWGDGVNTMAVLGGFSMFNGDTTSYPFQGEFTVDSASLVFGANSYYAGGYQLFDAARAPASITMYCQSNNSQIIFATKDSNTAEPTTRMTLDKIGDLTIANLSGHAGYYVKTDANGKLYAAAS
jgi:hypothetical protein